MTRWSATAGLTVWCGLAVQFAVGRGPVGLVELLFLLAPLVAVPLGLELAQSHVTGRAAASLLRLTSSLQPAAALFTVASFWLEAGRTAAILAGPWMLVCGVAGLAGALHMIDGAWRRLEDLCVSIGLLFLPIGGGWLAISRAGIAPMEFAEPIVLLTATHFHYAGFATALITGATAAAERQAAPNRMAWMRCVATGVLLGPALVAAGFVLSLPFKIFAVIWFALSLQGMALRSLFMQWHERGMARRFLLLSSASVLAGMMLAVVWGVEEWTGRTWVDLAHMARTHGVLNGPGFVLCGLLGWLLKPSTTVVSR